MTDNFYSQNNDMSSSSSYWPPFTLQPYYSLNSSIGADVSRPHDATTACGLNNTLLGSQSSIRQHFGNVLTNADNRCHNLSNTEMNKYSFSKPDYQQSFASKYTNNNMGNSVGMNSGAYLLSSNKNMASAPIASTSANSYPFVNPYGPPTPGLNRNRYMPYNYNRAYVPSPAENIAKMPTTGVTNTPNQYRANGNLGGNIPVSDSNYFTLMPNISTVNAFATINYPYEDASHMFFNCMAATNPTRGDSERRSKACQYASEMPTALATTKGNFSNFNGNRNSGGMGMSGVGYASASEVTKTTQTSTKKSAKPNQSMLGEDNTMSSSNHFSTITTFKGTKPKAVSSQHASVTDPNQAVTLQFSNLDYLMDEDSLKMFLLNQLKPITPVVSLVFEGTSFAKVTVPDSYFAKQVVANLHRKKIGHKRMLVSYTRDSSLTEFNTLRCQVAGLLKDVPSYTLPMYKFRELFQTRFKTSISVLDLYKMQDICIINSDNNDDKFISLQPDLINSLENYPLMEGLEHSVPYCTEHFEREQDKWAEQEIEPLPNVFMKIPEIQEIIYPLLKDHKGDIPVATLVHCIERQINFQIIANDNGVNLEHLVCCIQGVQIQINNFGIKILGWLELDKENLSASNNLISDSRSMHLKGTATACADPLHQISREVIELLKMCPKSTMKFSRFIPAYHNHFGKQCRVADYGYTKLIELFEALATVVQIMGDGENRQITLTHRTQVRRFTSDLLRVLRTHNNKSILLSQLPQLFTQNQNRRFDITDYGVCSVLDILDVNSNAVIVSKTHDGKDILISLPKRKQTNAEAEKTCIFAGEMVELFRNAPQYTILFQKFVRSYNYHFAYQCRLSDYGFLKLADLMDAIHGVVEMEQSNDEDRKIYLSPKIARRVFAEQCAELIKQSTDSTKLSMKLEEVLKLHKKKYGYQLQPQTLDVEHLDDVADKLPFVESTYDSNNELWITCQNEDPTFRVKCYRACKQLLAYEKPGRCMSYRKTSPPIAINAERKKSVLLNDFIVEFNAKYKESLTESAVKAMKDIIELYTVENKCFVRISNLMRFLLKIITLLEERSKMQVMEIKSHLGCTISSTFEFGYPNIFAVITAYRDLFTINIANSQERSEVSLVANCILHSVTNNKSNNNKSHGMTGYHKSQQHPLKSKGRRIPLGDHNSRTTHSHNLETMQSGPPPKMRNLQMDTSISAQDYEPPLYKHFELENSNNVGKQVEKSATEQPRLFSKSPLIRSIGSSSGNSSKYSSTQNSSSLNSSVFNKENSLNTSFNFSSQFNSTLNSSLASDFNASGLNSSLLQPFQPPIENQSAEAMRTTSSLMFSPFSGFSKINEHFPNQSATRVAIQMMNALENDQAAAQQACNIQANPTGQTSSLTSPHMFLNPNEYFYAMHSSPSKYGPPKPDSPLRNANTPFWMDPIWTNPENLQDNLLNIKLPVMTNSEGIPNPLSPYSLAKNWNNKRLFDAENNYDRKLA